MKIVKKLMLAILFLCLCGCDSGGDSYTANTCAQDAFYTIVDRVTVVNSVDCSYTRREKDVGVYLYFYTCHAITPYDEYSGIVTITLPTNGGTGSWRVSSGDYADTGECINKN